MPDDTFIIDPIEAEDFPIRVGLPYQIPNVQSPWEQNPTNIRTQTFSTPVKSDPSGLTRDANGPYGMLGQSNTSLNHNGPTGSMVNPGGVVGDRVWIDVVNGGEYVVRHIGPSVTCYYSQGCPPCPVISGCNVPAYIEVDELGHVTAIGVSCTCTNLLYEVCIRQITP